MLRGDFGDTPESSLNIMDVLERTLVITLLRAIPWLPRHSTKKSIEKWIRTLTAFDLVRCRVCDEFKPPKFFTKSSGTRCAYCTSQYKKKQYWKDPVTARQAAQKIRDRKKLESKRATNG